MVVRIWVFLSSLAILVVTQEGSEEERLGFFPDVPEVECECAINVQLKGDERQMTWTDSSSCPYPGVRDKVYDPYTAMKRDDGSYVCRVKGGHCIDITYWDPLEPEKLYDDNSTYCHNRDCARKVFRMRGCVASDEFIQQVYKTNKEKNTSSGSAHYPKQQSVCHGTYGSPPEFSGTYSMEKDYGIWGISHVPVAGKCEPMCAPTNHTDEKARCDVKHNSCKWSRIYCCNETMCNSDEGMSKKYFNATYNEWMDRLEDSMRKKRAVIYSNDSSIMKINFIVLIFSDRKSVV